MAKDLIIQTNEQIASYDRSEVVQSALQDFNLPILSNDKLEIGKGQFLKILRDCVVDINVIQQIANSKMMMVEIPQEFQKLFSEGKVHLGDSSKVFGNRTPNLYDGEGKLLGQATIKSQYNPANITNALANLALYSSIQQISTEIEHVMNKVTTILQGQKNNRYAQITGAYSSYELFLDEDEKKASIPQTLLQIKTGLHEIHLEVDSGFTEMGKAPKNLWEYYWKGFAGSINPFNAETTVEWEAKSKQVLFEFELYYKLILLSDILLNDMGKKPSDITNNHIEFNNLCNRLLSLDNKNIIKALTYSIGNNCEEIQLLSEAEKHYMALLNQEVNCVKIELSPTDTKLLYYE